jgi:hypothetical protein
MVLTRSLVLFVLITVPAVADCGHPVEIRFSPGSSSTDVEGALARGDRDCFTLRARAGQKLELTQPEPADDNIAFQLYAPPWTVRRGGEGWAAAGHALPGAGETDDAAQFSGGLPLAGQYLIVVGTTRGSGIYRLHIAIH